MHGAEASMMEGNSGLSWVGGHNGLMTWKDYIIHTYFKMLLIEKDMALCQRLCTGLYVRYYITSDDQIKMFDSTVQLLKLTE